MSRKRFSEAKINRLITSHLKSDDFIILNELRIPSAEFDIIIFDKASLKLINIEIKTSRWAKLMLQAKRGKLYCHYSMILAPKTIEKKIALDEFASQGIGVILYEEGNNDIDPVIVQEPAPSDSINRNFKKKIYKHVINQLKGELYA